MNVSGAEKPAKQFCTHFMHCVTIPSGIVVDTVKRRPEFRNDGEREEAG